MAKPIHILTAGSDNEPVAAFKNRADAELAYDAISAWFAAKPKRPYTEKKYKTWMSLIPCCVSDYITDNRPYIVSDLNLDIKETVLLSKFK